MDFASLIAKCSETTEVNEINKENFIDKDFLKKYNELFDDDLDDDLEQNEDKDFVNEISDSELEEKYTALFDEENYDEYEYEIEYSSTMGQKDDENTDNSEQNQEQEEFDISQKREPNTKYEINGNIYETDDNGCIYKKNGKLLPNTEYTVNGNTYKTDGQGRIVETNSKPKYTEESSRNTKEQMESGGEDRQENDDGGHIIAKILGGAEGEENLVPMRRTINRGDYKKMENEIAAALKEGKDVEVNISIEYDENSERPSKIRAEYYIDGKKTVVEFDNEENSTELLSSLDGLINDEDYQDLKNEIDDMENDGNNASITSVKVEYDEDGNVVKVTVCVLDETTGEKDYRVFTSSENNN